MICSHCGYENRSGARFCANCGTHLAPAAAPAEQTPVTPENIPPETDLVEVLPAAAEIDAGSMAAETMEVDREDNGNAGSESASSPSDTTPPTDILQPDTLEPDPGPADLPPSVPTGADLGDAESPTEDAFLVEETDATVNFGSSADGATVPELPPANERGLDAAGESAIPPLEQGTLIAQRFYVLSQTAEQAVREYIVQDRGICISCGSLVTTSAEEPYCPECGAYLLDENAPFAVRVLREVQDGVAAGEVFNWQGMLFALEEQNLAADAERVSSAPNIPFPRGVVLMTGQRSDSGILRAATPDEDSVFTLTIASVFESRATPTIGLYLVADGMGGHGDGEVASRIAAEAVGAALLQTIVIPLLQGQAIGQDTIGALMDAAIVAANRRVYENARARGNDMGTTLTLALVIDDQAYIANVGDSRTYLWRQGELKQITEDHSAVYQLVRKGILRPEDIYTHPRRNEITRNLGFRPEVQVDYFQQELAPHDALLLCCDGLWEMLHDEGIADVLLSNFGDVQTVCDALIKRANQAGGEDNISVVLVRAEA